MAEHTSAPARPERTRPDVEPRRVSTRELFADHSRVVIEHRGARYELRITRQGKLILTK